MDRGQQNITSERKNIVQPGKRSSKLSKAQREQILIGPNPRKIQKKQYIDLVQEALPISQYYQISYMHKDVVSHILASTNNDLIITVSIDGHIKFWQKLFNLIGPIKTIKAHNGLVNGVCLSKNQELLASVGIDKMLRIFDVQACELKTGIKLSFASVCCDFFPPKSGFDCPLIILGQEKSPRMIIVDYERNQQNPIIDQQENVIFGEENIKTKMKTEQLQTNKQQQGKTASFIYKTLNIHKHPIKFIKMNWKYNVCISIDERAFLEVWNPQTFDIPSNLGYAHKMETNYFELIKANSAPIAMTVSQKQNLLAVMLKDMTVHVYNIQNGKKIATVNQSIKEVSKIQQSLQHQSHQLYSLDNQTFQRKITLQKDVQISKQSHASFGVDFDEAQEYLVYSSSVGIVYYSLAKKCRQFLLGKKEHQRFLKCVFYQGRVMRNPTGSSSVQGQRKASDPLLLCTSFRRPRFYIFSKRQPQIEQNAPAMLRDVINERTAKQQAHMQITTKPTQNVGNQVVLNTTHGDIHLFLYTQDCPKTCQNFIKLVKKNYYNGLVFHRVVKGFMNQTGCPKGDGTGGQSIWGGNFKDQIILQKYRFEKPYCLAMANRGPDTNGSQFFITVVACPWLDGKHTIFGRVTKGIQTVLDINKIKTDKFDKPLITVKILSARVL